MFSHVYSRPLMSSAVTVQLIMVMTSEGFYRFWLARHTQVCGIYAFTHMVLAEAKAHSQGHSHTSVKNQQEPRKGHGVVFKICCRCSRVALEKWD